VLPGGVCGGIANYLNVDPTLARLVAVLLIFLGGFVILAYILFAIVIPLEPSKAATTQEGAKESTEGFKESVGEGETDQAQTRQRMTLGVVLIIVGILFLAGVFNIFWWFRWSAFWSFVLVVIGMLIILAIRRR